MGTLEKQVLLHRDEIRLLQCQSQRQQSEAGFIRTQCAELLDEVVALRRDTEKQLEELKAGFSNDLVEFGNARTELQHRVAVLEDRHEGFHMTTSADLLSRARDIADLQTELETQRV